MTASHGRHPVARILSGSLVGQGILILISPLLTRLYEPKDFGALAITTAVSAVLGRFITLSWESAIAIPRSEDQARSLAWLALYSSIGLACIASIVAYIWRYDFAALLNSQALIDYWWIVPLTAFIIAIYKIASTWVVRQQRYQQLAYRNAIQGISQAAFNVGLGLVNVTPLGLIGGLAFGRATALVGIIGRVSFFAGGAPDRVTLVETARRFARFPLLTSWSSTINTLGLQLPILILTGVYGSVLVGFLALTMRVLATPVGIVADAVSQHFEGTFASRLRSGGRGTLTLVNRTITRLALVGVLPTGLIVVLAPWAFGFIFGAEWEVAGVYAQILVIGYLLQFIVSPVSRATILLEHQRIQLIWDIGRAVLTNGSVLVAAIIGAPIIAAIAALAISQVLSYATLYVLTVTVVRKNEGRRND